MSISRFFLLSLASMFLAACGSLNVKLDSNSDGDDVRDQALGLFLDNTTTDSVNGEEGDHTDWKYLDLIDKGGLRIELGVDSPERLKGGTFTLYDEYGKRLDRLLIMPNRTSYVFEQDVAKVPNKFYVRAFTKEGRSAYSVGARLAVEPSDVEVKPVAPVEVEYEAEPECQKGEVFKRNKCRCKSGYVQARRGCRVKRKPSETRTRPKPKPESPQVVAEPPPKRARVVVATAVAAKQVVSGKVVRVVPSDNGNSVIININLNSSANLKKGAKGVLYKGGSRLASFRVSGARGRAARATVRMRSADITGGSGNLTVKITVD